MPTQQPELPAIEACGLQYPFLDHNDSDVMRRHSWAGRKGGADGIAVYAQTVDMQDTPGGGELHVEAVATEKGRLPVIIAADYPDVHFPPRLGEETRFNEIIVAAGKSAVEQLMGGKAIAA